MITEFKPIQRFIPCECHTEGILITIDGNLIYLSIYQLANTSKPSIIERIKYAWNHLWTGDKHKDQIILSKESIKELSEYLKELCGE